MWVGAARHHVAVAARLTRKRHAANLAACYLPRHSRVHQDNLGRQKGQRQMCEICSQRTMGRRRFLALAGFGLAAGGALFGIDQVAAAHGPTTSVTANQALANLKSGNAKYVKSPQVCAADLAKRRTAVTTSQTPWATILGCADSRVPPELLFGGLGVGELFVARNAGNTADTATMGTIEYGAAVLGVPLIVVLGHERCGAVAAACDVVSKQATFPGSIGPMVEAIVPAARAVKDQPGDFVDNAVRENARRTAAQVSVQSRIVADLVAAGKVKVLAARYDLDTGKVEYLA
jgi:carbonic anhydrase